MPYQFAAPHSTSAARLRPPPSTPFGAFATPAPTGYQYDYTYNGGTAVALVVVPEPGALILLGTSLPTLLWWVWRRRR
jgi:hypothetical protein